MEKLTLRQDVKQIQHLSPQMLQSTRVLQMDAQELHDYVNAAVEENPLLEKEPESQAEREFELLRRQVSWLGTPSRPTLFSDAERDYRPEQGAWDRDTVSLQALLNDQLERRRLDAKLLALCQYLVQLLDEDGYLAQEDIDNVLALGVPEKLAEQAVETLQQLEPAGVAARDLRECLLLQLDRLQGEDAALARRIVDTQLSALGKKRWRMLAETFGVTEDAVQRSDALIQRLSPHPGRSDEEPAAPEFVTPDVFVAELDGRLQVFLNDRYTPRVSISSYYAALLQKTDDAETKAFLQRRMQQARWVIDCLERRRSTLQSCAQLIFTAQADFFHGKSPHLSPLTQKEAALHRGVHESTLGRCIRGKYLQCRQGTYPLQYFFPHAVGTGGCSEQALQLELSRLIAGEDRKKPFSDQVLSALLARQGITAARRTVAKYRETLGIPPAYGRRKWQSHQHGRQQNAAVSDTASTTLHRLTKKLDFEI